MAELHVAIYTCEEEDVPHWCLYTVDDDGDGRVFEALGSTGHKFKYHTRDVDIAKSATLSETVEIGRIEADVWPEVPDLLKAVPMSKKQGWNCQNWVMEAIAALKREGYLERKKGGMSRIESKYQKKWKDVK